MRSGFSDAQCGFKALRSHVARALLPLIEDENWFFDTWSDGSSAVETVVKWVEAHGTKIPSSKWGRSVSGTLYEVTSGTVRSASF